MNMEETPKSMKKFTHSMLTFNIPLMDKEAKIYDFFFPLNLTEVRQNLLNRSYDSRDPFRVVQFGLCYTILPHTYHFIQFIS